MSLFHLRFELLVSRSRRVSTQSLQTWRCTGKVQSHCHVAKHWYIYIIIEYNIIQVCTLCTYMYIILCLVTCQLHWNMSPSSMWGKAVVQLLFLIETRRVRCSRCCLGAWCRAPTFGLMAASDLCEASNCESLQGSTHLNRQPRLFLTGWEFYLRCHCLTLWLATSRSKPRVTLPNRYTGQWRNNRMHGKHGVQDQNANSDVADRERFWVENKCVEYWMFFSDIFGQVFFDGIPRLWLRNRRI